MSRDLNTLLKQIERQLDWGSSESWQGRDFDNLNTLILDKTGVSLSASTLRRIWGKVEYHHLPSATTLDTLAKFAGHQHWRDFQKSQQQTATTSLEVSTGAPPAHEKKVRRWTNMIWIVAIMVMIGLASIFGAREAHRSIKPSEYSFSSQPLVRGIPNSVVFTYDARQAPTDSIFIQQSWDDHTRTLVNRDGRQHTSIYYEPGFYRAKLFVDTVVVKEHPLIIPTEGWLGLIEHQPVPVYLKPEDFITKDSLYLPVSRIAEKNVSLQPNAPTVKYYNVGNFDPVPVNDFAFSAEIRNEYHDGSAACQLSAILLITDDNPIIIPLSVRGCASELNLLSVDQFVSGKKADLSGFTADFDQWAKLSCQSDSGKIFFSVNHRLAYRCALPARPVHIVGLAAVFQGTGALRAIRLSSGSKTVFQDF